MEKNKWFSTDEKSESEIPTASYMAYEWIEKNWTDNGEHYNRCSEATMCTRRRWYAKNGYVGTPLSPRKRLNFLAGDIAEMVVKYIIAQSMVGEGKVYSEINFGDPEGFVDVNGKQVLIYKQIEVKYQLPNGEYVTGHPDGLGKRSSDGKWELIEIKSASNWGFKSFKESGPEDYIKQVHSLMLSEELAALNVRDYRFFYFRKETGNIWDRTFQADDAIFKEVIQGYLEACGKEIPAKPFELEDEVKKERSKEPGKGNTWITVNTGRKTAVFPCTYCPFLRECQGEYSIEFAQDQFGFYSPKYYF